MLNAGRFVAVNAPVVLVAVADRCRFWSHACRRGLKASLFVRLPWLSNTCSISSIARRCHWLKANASCTAAGANPNPFYHPLASGRPLIGVGATLPELKLPQLPTIDFATKAGGSYEIKSAM